MSFFYAKGLNECTHLSGVKPHAASDGVEVMEPMSNSLAEEPITPDWFVFATQRERSAEKKVLLFVRSGPVLFHTIESLREASVGERH